MKPQPKTPPKSEAARTYIVSTRVPESIKNDLDWLAKETNRSQSFLLGEAIREYLEHNKWQIEAIKEGLEDVENGRVISHEKIVEWIDSWGTDEEKARPK